MTGAGRQPPEPERRLRWWLPVVVATVAGVAVLAVGLLPGDKDDEAPVRDAAEPAAVVVKVQSEVHVRRAGARRTLAAGATIAVGETIDTGSGAALSLVTSTEAASLDIDADGSMTFEGPTELNVTAGRLTLAVPDTVLFGVTTPHGLIVGRHSRIAVAVSAAGTDVEVIAGDALVRGSDGKQRIIAAGARMSLVAPAPKLAGAGPQPGAP